MDDKAQVSMEYMILVAIALALAAVAALLAANIYSMKEGLKQNIEDVRAKMLLSD